MLRFENVCFGYNEKKIINDLSFVIAPNQHTAIIGCSGSGKSTILRLICGLEEVSSGKILMCKNNICKIKPCERKVGILFQDYSLFPHLTVSKNILFANPKANVKDLLGLVQLENFENRYPHELSGGQMQRIALARVLATDPCFLLLDEPFANLDNKLRLEIIQQLKLILAKRNVTLILVSHDASDVDALCSNVINIGC